MGLTRCYKTEGLYIYVCSFSTIFYAISISDTSLRSRKSVFKSNFDKISRSTAEIKLLPISENRRPPYWNSCSCFDFDERIVIGVQFCICLPNFVVIGRSSAELRRHIHFYRSACNADLVLWWDFCLSVRPSVCHMCDLWQNGRKICPNF